MIPVALKNRLVLAIGTGAIAIAGVMVSWHEGTRDMPYRDPPCSVVWKWKVSNAIDEFSEAKAR